MHEEFPYKKCNRCSGLKKTKTFDTIYMFCKLVIARRIMLNINCPAYSENEKKIFRQFWNPKTKTDRKEAIQKTTQIKLVESPPQPATSFNSRAFCQLEQKLCRLLKQPDICTKPDRLIRREDLDKKPSHKKDKQIKAYGEAKVSMLPHCPLIEPLPKTMLGKLKGKKTKKHK